MVEEENYDMPPSSPSLARAVVLAAAEAAVIGARRVVRLAGAVRDAWNSLGEWFYG